MRKYLRWIVALLLFASAPLFAQDRGLILGNTPSGGATQSQMGPGSNINDQVSIRAQQNGWTNTNGLSIMVYFSDGNAAIFNVNQYGQVIPQTDALPDDQFQSSWDRFMNWITSSLDETYWGVDANGDGDTADVSVNFEFLDHEPSCSNPRDYQITPPGC